MIKRHKKFHKNIYKKGNRYSIEKTIKGQHKCFKTFDNLQEAINYRDQLQANNWTPLLLTDEEIYEQKYKKYYQGIIRTQNGRRYKINNNHGKYLACTDTIEKALLYRDHYYTYNKQDAPRPNTLDLENNNHYITNGLQYPIPDRLIPFKNNSYGEGYIKKKGEYSYHIYQGSKNTKGYVCACRTYEQAYYVQKEMNKAKWDRTELPRILKKYPLWYTWLMEFYRFVVLDHEYKKRTGNNKYSINIPKDYWSDSKNPERITGYNKVEDALHERDFLVANDWDYDLLVESIDDTCNPYYDMEIPPYPQHKIRNLKERDYHEDELTIMYELINEDPTITQREICEILEVTEVSLRKWLEKFWGTTYEEFFTISKNGENPLILLDKRPIIYTPDLSRPKPSNFKNYIHYVKYNTRSPYEIVKDNIRYGSYHTEKQARAAVLKLKQCNWDKSRVSEIQESVGWKPLPHRGNIYPNSTGKSWSIRKKDKNRKMINYGTYKEHGLAVIIRDLLIENNWDKSMLYEIRRLAEVKFRDRIGVEV